MILLFFIAVFFLVKFQARRIVTSLIESNSNGQVEVAIGSINIQPFNSSIRIKSLSVLVKDKASGSYKKVAIQKVFMDVVSLYDFFTGGTLIIEKFESEGAELTIFNNTPADTTHQSFSLSESIQRLKKDAVRFQIQDIVFRDLNLVLSNDSVSAPTTISHIYARAQDLYLSADSIFKKKPVVEFSLPRQVIHFPNDLSLGFDSLSFTTQNNSIQVLNLDLKSPPSAVNRAFHVQSDKVKVTQFSFESLYSKGKLEIDSVFFGKSGITVDWTINQSEAKSGNTQPRIPALPQMEIRSIAFNEIMSDVTIRNDSVRNTFNVERASLVINQFQHNPDSSRVIYSPYYNLVISKYSTFLGKNNASISFDTIQIQKRSLSLLNFAYRTAAQKQPLIQTPRFELERVDWYELLVNRKLVAEEVLVIDPTIVTTIKPSAGDSSVVVNKYEVLNTLNEFLDVNLFSLRNASAFVHVPARKLEVVLNGYYSTFKVNDLINSATVNEGQEAIRDLSFKSLRVTNPDFTIHLRGYKYKNRRSSLVSAEYQAAPEILLQVEGMRVGAVDWNEITRSLTLDELSWEKLSGEIEANEKHTPRDSTGIMPHVYVNNIRGGVSTVIFLKPGLDLRLSLAHLNLSKLYYADSLDITGIDLKGNSLTLGTRLNDLRMGGFSFSDEGGVVYDIWFNRNTKEYLNVVVGTLSVKASLPDFLHQKYVLHELSLDRVKAKFNMRDSVRYLDMEADNQLIASDIRLANQKISVGSLEMDAGPFNVISENRVKNEETEKLRTSRADMSRFRSTADSVVKADYSIKKIKRADKKFKLASAENDTASFLTRRMRVGSEKGSVKFNLSNIQASLLDSSASVNAKLNTIQFSEVDFETDKLIAWIKRGSLNNLVVHSDHARDTRKWMEDNYPTAGVRNMQGRIEVNGNLIRFDQFDYHPASASGIIRQFEFRPLADKQQFLEDSYYQTNYMDTRIQSVSFNKFNVKRFLDDTVVHLASIQVAAPSLDISRDKTHPFFATAIKPLPTNAFQKLNVKFKIDTLNVSEGAIAYTEKSRITGKEGTITFSEMNASVRNVKNIELHEDDSLHIVATTRFMDSAKVNLRVRESYRDSLAGFLLTTQVSPFHTSILNKALVPMVSVDFKSGFVDTLYLRAVGREYVSLGSMKFLYHDLKVEFLDKDDTSRHSIKNQLLKFAANTFVVRTNNKDRTGKIFYERDRNRAVFQYWVKMILSGVTTSVGAKSNKKQIKKYMKDLNQKKLPPIKGEFDL